MNRIATYTVQPMDQLPCPIPTLAQVRETGRYPEHCRKACEVLASEVVREICDSREYERTEAYPHLLGEWIASEGGWRVDVTPAPEVAAVVLSIGGDHARDSLLEFATTWIQDRRELR